MEEKRNHLHLVTGYRTAADLESGNGEELVDCVGGRDRAFLLAGTFLGLEGYAAVRVTDTDDDGDDGVVYMGSRKAKAGTGKYDELADLDPRREA